MAEDIFAKVLAEVKAHGLRVLREDRERPWGGVLVLDNTQMDLFAQAYFPHIILPRPQDRPAMQPRILIVAPGKRFSWQYHKRRAEEWRVLEGPVGVARGFSDQEPQTETVEAGATLRIATGERHRLYGLKNWGVVPEIWVFTDPTDPSNDDDIVRLADDYNRQTPAPKPRPRFYT